MAKGYRPVRRDQPFLFPPDMREWLAADHPVWLVIRAGGRMDTSAFHARPRTGHAGTAGCDPAMLAAPPGGGGGEGGPGGGAAPETREERIDAALASARGERQGRERQREEQEEEQAAKAAQSLGAAGAGTPKAGNPPAGTAVALAEAKVAR